MTLDFRLENVASGRVEKNIAFPMRCLANTETYLVYFVFSMFMKYSYSHLIVFSFIRLRLQEYDSEV